MPSAICKGDRSRRPTAATYCAHRMRREGMRDAETALGGGARRQIGADPALDRVADYYRIGKWKMVIHPKFATLET